MSEKNNKLVTSAAKRYIGLAILVLSIVITTIFVLRDYNLITLGVNNFNNSLHSNRANDHDVTGNAHVIAEHLTAEDKVHNQHNASQLHLGHASEITKDRHCSQEQQDYIRDLNNYRRLLSNVQHVIINFMQDKSYLGQLKQLEVQEFPQDIKVIVEYLIEYDKNYLLDNSDDYEQVFPAKLDVVARMLKITKKSDKLKNKEALRAKIITHLEMFTNFIYSEELQSSLVNKGK